MELYMRGMVVPLLYFLFIIIAMKFDCCIGHSSLKVRCREEEREALLSFKKSVYDDPYDRLSSWVSDHEECCDWEGVRCHNITGHVLKLNLQSDGLSGKISSSLLHLKHLQYLDLSDNYFGSARIDKVPQHSIPKFLGSLSNLRYLNLSNAKFGGVIPRELGNLSKLHYLDFGISYHLNVEDLEWISGLPFLEYLDMGGVNMSKASNWLQAMNKLPSLSVLILSSCELSPPIDPLPHVNFSSLLILDLSDNGLISSSSSFDWFADLTSLTTLNLAQNEIHGQFPSGVHNMTCLKFLDLSYNNFASSLPDWLFHVTTLEHLYLITSMFQNKLPNNVGNLSSITDLDLSYNALEGDILRSLGNLCAFQLSNFSDHRPQKSLEFLRLKGNQLSGSFPDSLGECKSLEYLDLGGNQLSGNLPSELGQLQSLSTFFIGGNMFSGKIPISLGGLSSLRHLSIGENLFEGILSEKHLANLTSLEELDASPNLQLTVQVSSNWTPPFQLGYLHLGSCLLGPPFPAWLQTQKNLDYLNMSYAGISGAIPAWFWTRHYDTVDLSHNQIIGNIPSLHSSHMYLGSNNFADPLPQISSDVSIVDLSNNVFRGSLSLMLCVRTKGENSLQSLDISRNLLSGELPNCWMHWRYLTRLKLDYNNLTGGIPSSMGSLTRLASLHLRNNHISGDFPLSLKNCSRLMVVDLSENEFTGSLPAWMGNFIGDNTYMPIPGLMVLVLRSNKFNGSIPVELCHLEDLQILDLGNNNLSGTIPRCFGHFRGMIEQLNSTYAFIPTPYYLTFGSIETATLIMKGLVYEYGNTLGLLSGIDLSSNELSGGIPEELTSLHGLIFLNLSHNHFQGKIPVKIGEMTALESLDLSMNRLSGVIPQGMATISFLSHLNLSYNNLSGKIPSGTQLQGFSPFSFIGNSKLCGAPLTHDCGEHRKPEAPIKETGEEDDSRWIDVKWFYLGMPWGFAVGFWAIFAPLTLKRAWRHAYFQFLGEMKYKLLGWCL